MNKNRNLFFWLSIIVTLISIGVHIYLTDHHYGFKFGETAGESLCNINEKLNCNTTTASPFSEVFGIPISIFGGLTHFFLLALLLAFRFPIVNPSTQQKLSSPIKLVSSAIFATSLIMGGISLFVLNTLCPMCTLSYGLSFIQVIAIWLTLRPGLSFDSFSIKFYPIFAVTLLAFSFFVHNSSMRQYGGKEVNEITRLQFEDWQTRTSQNITPIDPLTINASPDAKMELVEFADFLCPHCAKAFTILHNFVRTHPNVQLSFQAFPLDGECNSAIEYAEGTRCLLARISHCAGKQHKAWEMQEWIFNNQRELLSKDAVTKKVVDKLAEFAIDKVSFNSCLDSEDTRKVIKEQAALGVRAGVKGTPSLYINGKKSPPGFSIPFLEKVYRSLN